MEIKLNAGDKINIPENCKATIEDNLIVIEEKQEEKKDGDCSYYNSEDRLPLKWIVWYFCHATEEETRRLYKQMKEEGLYWNFITKCVETIDTKTAYNSLWYETDPLWHKISDGDLPNKSGMFLVSIKGGHHQVIRYCHKDKLWATVFEQEDLEYWRENPSLPGK